MFYGFMLKIRGHSWDRWSPIASKAAVPSIAQLILWVGSRLALWFKLKRFRPPGGIQIYSLLQDRAAPPELPLPPSSRKQRNLIPADNKRLATLFLLITQLSHASTFSLASHRDFTNKLRKHRSYQGMLQVDKLSCQELTQVHDRIKAASETAAAVTRTNLGSQAANVVSAIADTGCSYTSLNSFAHVNPSSIRRLSKPIKVGGIAGGIDVEFTGTAEFEVLLPSGKVEPIQEQVLINESLPENLFSPQAFLSHQANGGKGILPLESYLSQQKPDPSDYEQHFRVFANRAEWHKDGQKVLDLQYDDSFLP